MESKEYFEKVMQDYNQHRNGRSLRKYCKDEAIDYDWVIKFKKTYPKNYNEAFIFYSKDYRKVKILHYDINGWVMYSKWFTDGKFLQPKFEECKKCHEISRQTLTLLLSTSVQTKLAI